MVLSLIVVSFTNEQTISNSDSFSIEIKVSGFEKFDTFSDFFPRYNNSIPFALNEATENLRVIPVNTFLFHVIL